MKKKLLSVLLTAAMAATLLAGCGGSGDAPAADGGTEAPAAENTDNAGGTACVIKWLPHRHCCNYIVVRRLSVSLVEHKPT